MLSISKFATIPAYPEAEPPSPSIDYALSPIPENGYTNGIYLYIYDCYVDVTYEETESTPIQDNGAYVFIDGVWQPLG